MKIVQICAMLVGSLAIIGCSETANDMHAEAVRDQTQKQADQIRDAGQKQAEQTRDTTQQQAKDIRDQGEAKADAIERLDDK